jgi:pyruvate formate lyase activating enzyme
VDWPGQLAATVFAQGCPWDCAYCHNPHLLSATPEDDAAQETELLPWRVVRDWLETRTRLLDGVVFSGGEPLAQPSLAATIAETRALGFKVALHTSGVVPRRFAEVLPLLDWVGFDAKAPFARYEDVTRVLGSGERALVSLRLLLDSGVDYEVRTTVHPDLLGEEGLLELAEELRALGVKRWVLQPYRPQGARPGLDPAKPPPAELAARLAKGFASFKVRG